MFIICVTMQRGPIVKLPNFISKKTNWNFHRTLIHVRNKNWKDLKQINHFMYKSQQQSVQLYYNILNWTHLLYTCKLSHKWKSLVKNVTSSIVFPQWRRRLLEEHLLMTLILLELFLSIIFILIGYLKGEIYFRGVGVGLIIAWVTSFIAYLFKRLNNKTMNNEK